MTIIKHIYISLFILFCINSYGVNAQVSENKIYVKKSLIDSLIIKGIHQDKEILIQCLFSLNYILEAKKPFTSQWLDISILDSLTDKSYHDSEFLYPFINQIILERKVSIIDFSERISKWCYCYMVLESVFIFSKNNLDNNLYFEDVVMNIVELGPLIEKYVPSTQTIDALSLSQSKLLFLEVVNYATMLNEIGTVRFFERYFKESGILISHSSP